MEQNSKYLYEFEIYLNSWKYIPSKKPKDITLFENQWQKTDGNTMYRISHSNYNYRNREKWITSKHIEMQLRGLNETKKINIFRANCNGI